MSNPTILEQVARLQNDGDPTVLHKLVVALVAVEELIEEADSKGCSSGWPFTVDRVREAIRLRPAGES